MQAPPTLPPAIYASAADFILACLDPNPAGRLPAHSLLRLPFLSKPPSSKEAADAAAAMEDIVGLNQLTSKAFPMAGGGTASTALTSVGSNNGSDMHEHGDPVSSPSQNAAEGLAERGTYGSIQSAGSVGSVTQASLSETVQPGEDRAARSKLRQRSVRAAAARDAAVASTPTQTGKRSIGVLESVLRAWLRMEGGFVESRRMEAAFVANWPCTQRDGIAKHFGTALLLLVRNPAACRLVS